MFSIFSREAKLIKKRPTQYMVFLAMLIALSLVLMASLHFPVLPGFPFLEFDFADIPVAIAGLIFGPIGVIITAVLKVALYILIRSTRTLGIGELSNLICSLAFGLSVSLIYHTKENNKSLLFAFLFGIIIEVIIAMVSNWFLILPLFINAGYMPASQKSANTIFAGIMVFNLIKFGAQAAIGFGLFKAIEKAIPFKTPKKPLKILSEPSAPEAGQDIAQA